MNRTCDELRASARRFFPLRAAAAALLLPSALLAGWLPVGCAAGNRAELEAIAAVASKVQEVNSTVGSVQAGVATIGSNVQTNDAWTLRLMAGGGALLLLTYPVGKLIWLVTGKLRRRNRAGEDHANSC
jgi:hypothetical protein